MRNAVCVVQGKALLWAVMLGGNQTVATLSVAYLPTDYGGGSGGASVPAFEVMHPGSPHRWETLPASAVRPGQQGRAGAGGSAELTVPLKQGCAMVRLVV